MGCGSRGKGLRKSRGFRDTHLHEYCSVVYYTLKVWSTGKIRGTRVPQKAIVPVGRSRPYSIIILNMRHHLSVHT